MAAISTQTILQSMEWAKKMNFGRRSAIGNFLEPAITSANIIKQTILGPPFEWWWNNEEQTFACVVGQQDYVLNLPEFGHIDHASVQQVGGTSNNWMQLGVKNSLALDATPGRPQFICPHTQNQSTGDMTFRLMPTPDKAYPVSVEIQKAAAQITNVNQVWGIPDYMGYIYNWGFLAMMYMFADDGARFAVANQKFVAHLLGAAEGLTETERNIFLNNWNNLTIADVQRTQQGIQARGV